MKTSMSNWRNTVAIGGIVLGLGIVPYTVTASDLEPTVSPPSNAAVGTKYNRDRPSAWWKSIRPNTAAVGMTYGDWSAAWWQYILSIPSSSNPLTDDGSDTIANACSVGQSSGPVFFLAGSFVGPVTRQCTVPSVALFFPIINAECSDVEGPPFFGSNAHERRGCAAKLIDGVDVGSLKVTVDGKTLRGLGYFRVQSPDFHFTMPSEDNILGLGNVTSGNAVSDGYYVMFNRLTPGRHLIRFEGACVSGDCAGFSQDVTYDLTVIGD